MPKTYTQDQTFEKQNFTENFLPIAEYENCKFLNCDFSNSKLTECSFADCEFIGCNLSLAKIDKTSFREVHFVDCKLLGLGFDHCIEFLFSVSFSNCILNLASLYGKNLKKITFENCSLQDVDFTQADLSNVKFNTCDLIRAKFVNTNLEKADFRTSYNYSFNPALNRMKKAKFSVAGIYGLLDNYDIVIEN
mgnify:FL=1